ncbi:MAG: hypothetical protein M3Y08_17855 [Fibrobacterota bacterium]|nr:hypothetical protein [Fibrobacterota bacterium]
MACVEKSRTLEGEYGPFQHPISDTAEKPAKLSETGRGAAGFSRLQVPVIADFRPYTLDIGFELGILPET